MSTQSAAPDVSVVIPVYNEEGIISASVADLREKIAHSEKLKGLTFEIILSANGCKDRTVDIARELSARHPEIRVLESDEPNYGRALRLGIEQARGTYVVCDEIDLCDVDFYERALHRLREEGYDMVVGSKRLERSFDRRPAGRRFATSVINWLLWLATGFEGTDTHGLKAFVRERLLGVVGKCVVDRDMFASELVIRANRMMLRTTEIPIEVIEKRAPSVQLTKRVPRVLRQLATLAWVIRVKKSMSALVNLSVDLDSLSLYYRIHALEGDPDPRAIYAVALPRLLDLCARLQIRMTLFVVAADLQFDEAVTALRSAVAAGHEIASHTLRHPYHLRELSESGIAEEIDEAARWIEESLGVRPLGFRTPGYNLDSRILALLAERGYRYDASIFPCPPYFAAKAAVMARMASKGQPTGSAANDPLALLAPTSPYRPSRWGFWRRGDRKHSLPLWEIPCGVMPVTRLPVIGTTICALPDSGARLLARCFRAGQEKLSVAIHAIDLMDQHDRGVQAILVAKQHDLRRPWQQKEASLTAFWETLTQTHRSVTLLEMTDALDAEFGATVTGP